VQCPDGSIIIDSISEGVWKGASFSNRRSDSRLQKIHGTSDRRDQCMAVYRRIGKPASDPISILHEKCCGTSPKISGRPTLGILRGYVSMEKRKESGEAIIFQNRRTRLGARGNAVPYACNSCSKSQVCLVSSRIPTSCLYPAKSDLRPGSS
jgi:hypothetical protein